MVGRHPEFDDPKYWTFSRNSGLPRGYFDKRSIITADVLLVVCGAAVAVVAFFAVV